MYHYTVEQLMELMHKHGMVISGEGMILLHILIDTVPAARQGVDTMMADIEFEGGRDCKIQFCAGHRKA
jgi:hypothetical protein